MLIVFGSYTIRIKSLTPEQVGIPAEKETKVAIEVRQKVAHLMWIPIAPIMQMYAMRIKGKLYELPAEYYAHVDAHGPYRTPWYSYLLPILLVLGVIAFALNEWLRFV